MNEMKLGTGLADDRKINIPCIIVAVSQPMLHVHTRLGTLEKDMLSHAAQYAGAWPSSKFRMYTEAQKGPLLK